MAEIELHIHDIVNDQRGITFVEQDGSRTTVVMNEQEKELLRERLQEKV